MTSARDTAVQKLESKSLQQILGRSTCEHVKKMRGAIAAVYAEAKTSHDSSPLRSKFGFSAAILKKDKYISLHNTVATGRASTANLATTCSFIQPSWLDTYNDTILAVHPEVSRRKKEAQCAELITQYETFEGYKEAFKEKIILACDEAYLVTIRTKYLCLSTKLLSKFSTISSSNALP